MPLMNDVTVGTKPCTRDVLSPVETKHVFKIKKYHQFRSWNPLEITLIEMKVGAVLENISTKKLLETNKLEL